LSKLIFFQVSDVNDDVRRIAVTSLGFLLFRFVALCKALENLD